MHTSGNNAYSRRSTTTPQQNPFPSLLPSSLFNVTSSCVLDDYPYHHQLHGHGQSDILIAQDPLSSSSVLQIHNMISPNFGSVKNDRRTKISTSRGLRDRRVRLSMGIAREFFDLQDMLGFDKASKTLGWLLAESKSAIKELVSVKRRSSVSASITITSPALISEENNNLTEKPRVRKSRSRLSSKSTTRTRRISSARNKIVGVIQNHDALAAKEKRAEARERARVRTMKKEIVKIMSNKLGHPHPRPFEIKSLPFKFTSQTIPSSHSNHLGFVGSSSGSDTSGLSRNFPQVGSDAKPNQQQQQHMMDSNRGSCDTNITVKTLNCANNVFTDLGNVNQGPSDYIGSDSSFHSSSFWATIADNVQNGYLPLNIGRL